MQRVGAELQTQLADADQFETLAAEVDGLLSKAEEAANASQEKLAEPNATADSLGAAESALSSVDLSPLAEKLDELEKVAQNLPSDCQEKSASLRRRSASLSDNLGRLRQDAHQRAAALDDFDRKAADVRQQLDDMGAAAQTSRDKGPRDVDERAADLAHVQVTTPSIPPSALLCLPLVTTLRFQQSQTSIGSSIEPQLGELQSLAESLRPLERPLGVVDELHRQKDDTKAGVEV